MNIKRIIKSVFFWIALVFIMYPTVIGISMIGKTDGCAIVKWPVPIYIFLFLGFPFVLGIFTRLDLEEKKRTPNFIINYIVAHWKSLPPDAREVIQKQAEKYVKENKARRIKTNQKKGNEK